MAQFDASINLSVNSSKAEQQVKRLEAAVDKVNRAASKLDFNNKSLDKAAAAAERLYKNLEKIESAALSKLPTSVQTLIAYLKAANVATAKLTANAVGAAAGFKQIAGVNFAPIIRAQTQMIVGFSKTSSAIQTIDSAIVKTTSSFDLLLARIVAVRVQIEGIKKLTGGKAGFIGGGTGGNSGGGNSGGGGGGGQRSLPPADFSFLGNPNTLRGLQKLRSQLQNLLDTTVIGSKQFRNLENAIAGVNNRIKNAQLKGQRGGSGVPAAKKARSGFGAPGGGIGSSIGFPLLFGGGAGSIAGGVIGALSGGFDKAILGSGIGAQVDAFGAKLIDLSGALDGAGGSTQALETLIGGLDTETARRIENLEKSGQTALAANAAFEKLSKEIGKDLATAAVLAGQDLDNLGAQITKFFTILGVSIASLFQEALYLNTRDPLEGIPEVSPETAVERTTSGEAVELARTELELAEARLAKDEEAALVIERKLVNQRKANALSEVARQLEDNSLDAQIAKNRRLEIELQAKTQLADLEAKAASSAERKAKAEERSSKAAERAAQKARREAEAAERKSQAAFDKEQQVKSQIAGLQASAFQIRVQQIQLTAGESAALTYQLSIVQQKYELLEEQINFSKQDARLKDLQIQKLQLEKTLEKEQLNSRLRALEIEKEILKLKQQQALAGINTDIGRQIEDANFRGTGNTAQDEQLQLRIDQTRRAEDVTTRLNNALAEQQKIIDDPSTAKAAEDAERTRQNLKDELDLYNQLLPQLNAAEQAQLRYNQVLQAAQPYAEAFATGLTQGLRDVVAGTKTAEEAFADFLNNIADLLIQTAATMIAQYIAIGIAKAFAGMGDGWNPSQLGDNLDGINTSFLNFAEGGYVTGPTPAVVGEGGEPEYIIPASKMDSALARYSGGTRGDAVIDGPGSAEGGGGVALAEAPMSINISGGVTQIGNDEFIRKDQLPAIVAQASKAGEQRTLRKLQMSSASRRKLGM